MFKKIINVLNRLIREVCNRNVSDSSQKIYPDFCLNASKNENIFRTFRSHKDYKPILEHVGYEMGVTYFKNIKNISSLEEDDIFNICSKLSHIGGPELYQIKNYDLNPTSLRYLNVACDIRNKFNKQTFKNVIEIGAGYGGQSIVMNELFNIEKYTYVDLEQVIPLINKFVENYELNFDYDFKTLSDEFNSGYDLLISNYSFSELPMKLQKSAIKKIVNKSKNVYMICNHMYNFSFRYLNIKQLKKYIKNLEFHNEVPPSNIYNMLLIAKKNEKSF